MSEMNGLAAKAAELGKLVSGITPEKVRVMYDVPKKHWTATIGTWTANGAEPADALRALVFILEKDAEQTARGWQERADALRGKVTSQ